MPGLAAACIGPAASVEHRLRGGQGQLHLAPVFARMLHQVGEVIDLHILASLPARTLYSGRQATELNEIVEANLAAHAFLAIDDNDGLAFHAARALGRARPFCAERN